MKQMNPYAQKFFGANLNSYNRKPINTSRAVTLRSVDV